MLSLYRPFNNLFRDDFFYDDGSPFASSALARVPRSFTPAVNVVEHDNAYVLEAEVPGMTPEQIDLQVENDVLTLRGEQRSERADERRGYRRIERSYGTFARSFVLPQGTNVDAIEARVDNGVLTVTIPKVARAVPRKLQVKTGGIVDKAKKLFKTGEKPEENATA